MEIMTVFLQATTNCLTLFIELCVHCFRSFVTFYRASKCKSDSHSSNDNRHYQVLLTEERVRFLGLLKKNTVLLLKLLDSYEKKIELWVQEITKNSKNPFLFSVRFHFYKICNSACLIGNILSDLDTEDMHNFIGEQMMNW